MFPLTSTQCFTRTWECNHSMDAVPDTHWPCKQFNRRHMNSQTAYVDGTSIYHSLCMIFNIFTVMEDVMYIVLCAAAQVGIPVQQ